MFRGRCICDRPYYDGEGPCHYLCDCCGETVVSYEDATPGMIELGFCERCTEEHYMNEIYNEEESDEL